MIVLMLWRNDGSCLHLAHGSRNYLVQGTTLVLSDPNYIIFQVTEIVPRFAVGSDQQPAT
jgi:hypothetical protein